jgi:hypothetical protein
VAPSNPARTTPLMLSTPRYSSFYSEIPT